MGNTLTGSTKPAPTPFDLAISAMRNYEAAIKKADNDLDLSAAAQDFRNVIRNLNISEDDIKRVIREQKQIIPTIALFISLCVLEKKCSFLFDNHKYGDPFSVFDYKNPLSDRAIEVQFKLLREYIEQDPIILLNLSESDILKCNEAYPQHSIMYETICKDTTIEKRIEIIIKLFNIIPMAMDDFFAATKYLPEELWKDLQKSGEFLRYYLPLIHNRINPKTMDLCTEEVQMAILYNITKSNHQINEYTFTGSTVNNFISRFFKKSDSIEMLAQQISSEQFNTLSQKNKKRILQFLRPDENSIDWDTIDFKITLSLLEEISDHLNKKQESYQNALNEDKMLKNLLSQLETLMKQLSQLEALIIQLSQLENSNKENQLAILKQQSKDISASVDKLTDKSMLDQTNQLIEGTKYELLEIERVVSKQLQTTKDCLSIINLSKEIDDVKQEMILTFDIMFNMETDDVQKNQIVNNGIKMKQSFEEIDYIKKISRLRLEFVNTIEDIIKQKQKESSSSLKALYDQTKQQSKEVYFKIRYRNEKNRVAERSLKAKQEDITSLIGLVKLHASTKGRVAMVLRARDGAFVKHYAHSDVNYMIAQLLFSDVDAKEYIQHKIDPKKIVIDATKKTIAKYGAKFLEHKESLKNTLTAMGGSCDFYGKDYFDLCNAMKYKPGYKPEESNDSYKSKSTMLLKHISEDPNAKSYNDKLQRQWLECKKICAQIRDLPTLEEMKGEIKDEIEHKKWQWNKMVEEINDKKRWYQL